MNSRPAVVDRSSQHAPRHWPGLLRGAALHLPLAAIVLLFVAPLAYLVIGALKLPADIAASSFFPFDKVEGGIAWQRLTLSNFRELLALGLGRSLLNSVFLASVTSLLAVLGSAAAGYALAKFRFPGRGILTAAAMLALAVPGVLLIAPTYQLLYQLGLLDSHAGLILPAAAPAFGVYLFRQAALSSIPDELLEAARIDGCSELRIFVAIGLPLLRPIVGAMLMITFLGAWNNFIGPQIVLQSPEKMPLAVTVAQLRGVYGQQYGLLLAGTLLSIAPVMALFLLLERDFISGLTSGAVKG